MRYIKLKTKIVKEEEKNIFKTIFEKIIEILIFKDNQPFSKIEVDQFEIFREIECLQSKYEKTGDFEALERLVELDSRMHLIRKESNCIKN
jgi:hypothetical protein